MGVAQPHSFLALTSARTAKEGPPITAPGAVCRPEGPRENEGSITVSSASRVSAFGPPLLLRARNLPNSSAMTQGERDGENACPADPSWRWGVQPAGAWEPFRETF